MNKIQADKMNFPRINRMQVCGMLAGFFLLSVFHTTIVYSAEIEPVEKRAGVFGETDATFTFRIVADEAVEGKVLWSYSANGRTISRGESAIKHGDDGDLIEVKLSIPRATDGVVMETELSVRLHEKGDSTPVAEHTKTIWLFPEDPFFEKTEWLEELKITLFDPDGKTADLFDESEIPYEETKNLGALSHLDEGLLIVGEGVSFLRNRGLDQSIMQLAAKGIPVLVLAPSEGSLAMPRSDDPEFPTPKQFSLRSEDVLTEINKRFDVQGWSNEGKSIASRLHITTKAGDIITEVSEDEKGWPWIEADYAEKESTLLVCGFGIVQNWTDNPTPRFLLADLFEKLKPPPNSTTEKSQKE